MTKQFGSVFLALLGSLFAADCCAAVKPWLIEGVSIVDVANKKLLVNKTIEIQDERIVRIVESTEQLDRSAFHLIDGKGLYAIPPLFDCHVHLNDPERESLLMVANGVLFARDMGGETAKRISLRERAKRGELSGLQVAITGTILDGDPPYHPWAKGCSTPEIGRAAVRSLHSQGVDQIKVYSLLKPEVYKAILEEAKQLNLRVVGHIPDAIAMGDAVRAGQSSVEHFSRFETLFSGELPEEIRKSGRPEAFASGYWPLYARLSAVDKRKMFRELAERSVFQCPTMVLLAGQVRMIPDERMQKAWAANSDARSATWWKTEVPAQWAVYGDTLRSSMPFMMEALNDMHSAGVPLLVGTDLGNLGILAGFSVHQEMEMWQQAGIPAADVLRYATLMPARFLGIEDDYGAVAPKKLASFVMTRRNPLDDIAHASDIHSVFVRGKYLDRPALDNMLDAAKEIILTKSPSDIRSEKIALEGTEVDKGRLTLMYQQWAIGNEQFKIVSSNNGFSFEAIQDAGTWDIPTRTTGTISSNGTVDNFQWESLTSVPQRMQLKVQKPVAMVQLTRGKKLIKKWDIAVDESTVFLTTAAGMAKQLERFRLGTGESTRFPLVTWNASNLDFDVHQVDCTRLPNESLKLPSSTSDAVVYKLSLVDDTEPVVYQFWFGPDGLVLKSTRQRSAEVRRFVRE